MDKPFSMIYEEFKQNLTNLINGSNLPPFVLESILQNFLYEVSNVAKNQYKADRTQYESVLLDDNKEDGGKQ